MDYKLHITEQAVEQLDRIISYLVSNLKNPPAARKLLSEIETIYSHLESDPYIYSQCNDPFLRTKGYHKATVRHFQYMILFLIDDENRIVYISGLFHEKEFYAQKL